MAAQPFWDTEDEDVLPSAADSERSDFEVPEPGAYTFYVDKVEPAGEARFSPGVNQVKVSYGISGGDWEGFFLTRFIPDFFIPEVGREYDGEIYHTEPDAQGKSYARPLIQPEAGNYPAELVFVGPRRVSDFPQKPRKDGSVPEPPFVRDLYFMLTDPDDEFYGEVIVLRSCIESMWNTSKMYKLVLAIVGEKNFDPNERYKIKAMEGKRLEINIKPTDEPNRHGVREVRIRDFAPLRVKKSRSRPTTATQEAAETDEVPF